MKKGLSVLLAILWAFSLAACGGSGSDGQSEQTDLPAPLEEDPWLVSLVEDVYGGELPEGDGAMVYGLELAKSTNGARFQSDYLGKAVEVSGTVFQIEADYLVLGYSLAGELGTIGTNGGIHVYLDTEELAELTPLSAVTVVGTLAADESGTCTALLEDAYLVEE